MKTTLLLGHQVAVGQGQLDLTALGAQQANPQRLHHALAGQTGGDTLVFGGVHGRVWEAEISATL